MTGVIFWWDSELEDEVMLHKWACLDKGYLLLSKPDSMLSTSAPPGILSQGSPALMGGQPVVFFHFGATVLGLPQMCW